MVDTSVLSTDGYHYGFDSHQRYHSGASHFSLVNWLPEVEVLEKTVTSPAGKSKYPGVAQLAERMIWDHEAGSSILPTWTNLSLDPSTRRVSPVAYRMVRRTGNATYWW